jgi:hypothetical protein
LLYPTTSVAKITAILRSISSSDISSPTFKFHSDGAMRSKICLAKRNEIHAHCCNKLQIACATSHLTLLIKIYLGFKSFIDLYPKV